MTRPKDVLVVDDDVVHASAVAKILRTRFSVRIAVGLRDAIHELARAVPHIIICALEMPPYRGDALLAMIAREHPEVRRVLYTRKPIDGMVDADAVLARPVEAAALLAAIGGDGALS